jgi:hypothetical protein
MKMIGKILFAVVMGCVSTVSMAQSVPKFQKGEGYAGLRGRLLAQGYTVKPLPAAGFARCVPDRDEMCEAYPETRSCVTREQSICEFVLINVKTGPVSVMTAGLGLNPRVLSVKKMSESDISRMLAE